MATSFLRLVYITMFDPPYVPLGPSAPPARRDRVSYKNKGKARHVENGIAMGEYDPGNTSEVTPEENKAQNDPDSPGLELFYTKDVFTCVMDGRPSWCSSCANWKPDRAHHCSNSGRCIIKMDHFCPWVGGPIGENNFKFFIQFNGYAALFCIHLLIVMAIYIRKQITTEVWLK
jgi:palmitoyltransferase